MNEGRKEGIRRALSVVLDYVGSDIRGCCPRYLSFSYNELHIVVFVDQGSSGCDSPLEISSGDFLSKLFFQFR